MKNSIEISKLSFLSRFIVRESTINQVKEAWTVVVPNNLEDLLSSKVKEEIKNAIGSDCIIFKLK